MSGWLFNRPCSIELCDPCSQLYGSRTQQEAAVNSLCWHIQPAVNTYRRTNLKPAKWQSNLLNGLTQMHGRLLTAGHGSSLRQTGTLVFLSAAPRGSRRRSAKVWRVLIRRCLLRDSTPHGLSIRYCTVLVLGWPLVGRRKGKKKFCSSVSLHRRNAFVCGFHRANRQLCGSSETLPLCEAMWARLRWRDQGHFGRLCVLLACSESVRGGHVRFIKSSISMVCSREQAFPGTRTCMHDIVSGHRMAG